MFAAVNTMLVSFIITSKSVSIKSKTSDTLDLYPNTSIKMQNNNVKTVTCCNKIVNIRSQLFNYSVS